jgi:hypothetical protein
VVRGDGKGGGGGGGGGGGVGQSYGEFEVSVAAAEVEHGAMLVLDDAVEADELVLEEGDVVWGGVCACVLRRWWRHGERGKGERWGTGNGER